MPNIALNRFMIFNSSEGQDESREGDKLLYHWVRDSENNQVELREQIDDICLCDATINVTKRLNCDTFQLASDSVKDVCTTAPNIDKQSLTLTFETTLILILEVEPEQSIWFAVHVADNCNSDTISETSQTTISQSGERQHLPLNPSNIPADAVKRVVENIYSRFCLLNGSFAIIRQNVESETSIQGDLTSKETNDIVREKMRLKCCEFFAPLLPEIHLNSLLSNLASLYNYILYLDLNPLTLMKVNSFVNHLVCINANKIRHTIMIFNDKLLWSSLNKENTRLVYNYLVSSLIKNALQEELSREVDKVRRIAEDRLIYLEKEDADLTADENQSLTDLFYLTVFRSSNNLTLGLVLSEENQLDLLQKCEHFLTSDSRLGVVPLASLAQSVGQNFIRANAPSRGTSQTSGESRRSGVKVPNDQKYIMIDRIQASISLDSMLLAGVEAPNNRRYRLMRYLTEIEPDLAELERQTSSRVEEFYAKTWSDSWLTVTNGPFRSIYSTNKVRNSSLSEAQQTANNLRILLT